MNDIIFAPPVAFLIYIVVIALVALFSRAFAARSSDSTFKSATYASGEANDPVQAAPGYRQFFVIALFFAVLHLGVLMLGSSGLSLAAGPYLLGLILALVALILG